MLTRDHPDDERLSALAAGDTDASDDASLDAHVSGCDRCAAVVSELGTLRSALAELPDLAPHRPLRLVPPVDAGQPSPADRLGHWARRLFAPALTAGAALAMVGVIGTSLPALSGLSGAQSGGADEANRELQLAATDAAAPVAGFGEEEAAALESDTAEVGTMSGGDGSVADEAGDASAAPAAAGGGERGADFSAEELPAERSPWPMVLFAGVALMIGAALLRWIAVPEPSRRS